MLRTTKGINILYSWIVTDRYNQVFRPFILLWTCTTISLYSAPKIQSKEDCVYGRYMCSTMGIMDLDEILFTLLNYLVNIGKLYILLFCCHFYKWNRLVWKLCVWFIYCVCAFSTHWTNTVRSEKFSFLIFCLIFYYFL